MALQQPLLAGPGGGDVEDGSLQPLQPKSEPDSHRHGEVMIGINGLASVAYTIAAAACARAVRTSLACHGVSAGAGAANCGDQAALWREIAAFGAAQLAASQLPSLDDAAWSSAVGAATSLVYSLAALGLSLLHGERPVREKREGPCKPLGLDATERRGTSTGIPAATAEEKTLGALSALGGIAFALAFPTVLVERAIAGSLLVSFLLYMGVGVAGYAAFGNEVPDNVLAIPHIGPTWVLVVANCAVILHLLSAYQVYSQPAFAALERALLPARDPLGATKAGQALVVSETHPVVTPDHSEPAWPARLVLRSAYVVLATALAALLPCFSQILGLIGALLFWPAGVYFPITLYLQVTGRRGWQRCVLLTLTILLFFVSLAVAGAAVHGLVLEVLRK
ncbi:Amino acid permease 5 [Auxenochlorella protothecoides]|uniref:Amino acid permease 5 n=1 Tax=Auxenochlorella protothecoides TaxID=3075 RepID=A0A087SHR9_AUXPR|nr:Amino acid permease 5 [Auxenochlorella protothecoides]KFM25273.1 Amino acid permease 5 [Auxenochlorella protothecoides]